MTIIHVPPTIYDLYRDEKLGYAAEYRVNAQALLPGGLITGTPWISWAYKVNRVDENGKTLLEWGSEEFSTYADAFKDMRAEMKVGYWDDICIVSKRYFFAKSATCFYPDGFSDWQNPWCKRCRRPSTFEEKPNHHALKFTVPRTHEPLRCFYCGINQELFT